jgi:hypothetical protein
MKKLGIFPVVLAVFALVLSSCDIDGPHEDAGAITINFSSSGTARALINPSANGDPDINRLPHHVSLVDMNTSGMGYSEWFPAGTKSGTITVAPGTYGVLVGAYYNDIRVYTNENQPPVIVEAIVGQTAKAEIEMNTQEAVIYIVDNATDWYNIGVTSFPTLPAGVTKYDIIINNNITGASPIDFSVPPVTITGNNKTIKWDGSGGSSGFLSLLNIYNGQSVTLQDVHLEGLGKNVPHTSALVYIDGGSLTMKGDSSIFENNNVPTPGVERGGGVCVINSGSLTMWDNSKVYNNSISTAGGGVYVGDGTLTMNGNSSISGNTSDGGYGGGVFMSGGTFTMEGGTISGNTASAAGGGVYIYLGTFILNTPAKTGDISGNTSPTQVYKDSSGGPIDGTAITPGVNDTGW